MKSKLFLPLLGLGLLSIGSLTQARPAEAFRCNRKVCQEETGYCKPTLSSHTNCTESGGGCSAVECSPE